MGTAAEVSPAALSGLGINVVVDRQLGSADLHNISAALAADQTQLEGLIGEFGDRVSLVDHASGESLSGLDDGHHSLLENLKVLGSEGRV